MIDSGLISNYGRDFFIVSDTTHPDIIITTGYEKYVYINGLRFSDLILDSSSNYPYEDNEVYITTKNNGCTIYNAYDPSGEDYIPTGSSEYMFRSLTTTPTKYLPYNIPEQPLEKYDSSLFISENLPPFVSYINEYRWYSIPATSTYTVNGDTFTGTLLYIHIDCDEAFDIAILTSGQKTVEASSFTVINYKPEEIAELSYKKTIKMIDNAASYELLRVNPKLTGNVKVVVDSSQNLYLDTFKVSKALSQRKYRKISINPNEYYGRTLMSKMSSIPSTDFYKIEDSCYNLFSLANNLGEQYYDTYNSGVRTNNDKMYTENYSILAPLCIKKNIPDFFVVFRISDYENIETNPERIKKFLTDGEIVKVFDLRETSDAGKLIRKIYENAKNFVGDLYVSYDYDQSNIYNGISLDSGVVSQIYESASLCRNIQNQVAMNDWFTLGFERNRVVSKNIVNFEFMFDDTSRDLFSIDTYFGIYIKLNGEDGDFNCLGFDNNIPIFDTEIHGSSFNPSDSSFNDLIYGLATPDGFTRLPFNVTDASVYDLLKDYAKTPYENIVSPEAIDTDASVYEKCYATIQFNDVMDPGEHFRIVDTNDKKIYEVVISNYENDIFDISEINHYTETIESDEYEIERVTVYGIPYRLNISDSSITKDDEINLLVEAFNSFGEDIVQAYVNNDSVCLIYNSTFVYGSDSVYIEKVSSFYDFDTNYDNTYNSDRYTDDSAYLFGLSDIEKIRLIPTEDTGLKKILYPTGFEALGSRIAFVCSFIPFTVDSTHRLFHIDSNIDMEVSKERNVIYKDEEGYSYLEKINIIKLNSECEFENAPVQSLSGFGGDGSSIIIVSETPDIVEGKVLFYNLPSINAGLCSILQVKDIDTDVIDPINSISTISSDYISKDNGEFGTRNNVFGKSLLTVQTPEESVMNYIDKYERFKTYKNADGEVVEIENLEPLNLTGYLSTLNNADHKYSDVAMLSPYCCKWKVVGTDSRGDNMRVMFKYSDESENRSYFIPQDTDFYIGNVTVSDGSGYVDCSFDSCTYGYPKYLNDKFDPRIHRKFKDYLFNGTSSIDELLTNDGGGTAKMSTVYSNGNDTIEFIAGGVKVSIQVKESKVLDIKKYIGYSAIIICTSGNNPNNLNPCEILFDEENEQLAIFIYNGSAPWNMFYNDDNAKMTIDGSVRIPMIYSSFHTSSLSECKVNTLDSSKLTLIPDDAELWNRDCSMGFAQIVTSNKDSNGFVFLVSDSINKECFTKEKYSLLIGKVGVESFKPDFTNEYIASWDASLYVDSSRIDPFTSELKKCVNQLDDNIDMFIISGSDNEPTDPEFNKQTDYATLPLRMVKEYIKTPLVFVKTKNGTLNYSNLNDIIHVEIKDPVEINVENSDFEQTDSGTAYPSYCEPVTRNILAFENKIDGINSIFETSLDGCNLRVGNVNTIPQTWLRKVSEIPLTIDNRKSTTVETEILVTEFNIPSTSPLNYELRVGENIYDVTDEDNEKLYKITDVSSMDSSISLTVFDSSAISYNRYIQSGDDVIINGETYQINNVDSSTLSIVADIYFYTSLIFDIQGYPKINVANGTVISGIDSSIWIKESTFTYRECGSFNARSVGDSFSPAGADASLEISSNRLIKFNASVIKSLPETYTETVTSGSMTSSTCLNVLHNLNPLVDCWDANIYRTFTGHDVFVENNGIESGYEKNIFFASRGLNLKSENEDGNIVNFIEITNWTNTVIDRNKKKITLNITDSLINLIMYSDGYMGNWIGRTVNNPQSKQRYIENSILKFINIDENCKVEIWFNEAQELSFDDNSTSTNGMMTLQGINKNLFNDKGKYYLALNNLKDYIYTVKMKIYL